MLMLLSLSVKKRQKAHKRKRQWETHYNLWRQQGVANSSKPATKRFRRPRWPPWVHVQIDELQVQFSVAAVIIVDLLICHCSQHNRPITGSTILAAVFMVEPAGSRLYLVFCYFLVFNLNRTGLVAGSQLNLLDRPVQCLKPWSVCHISCNNFTLVPSSTSN